MEEQACIRILKDPVQIEGCKKIIHTHELEFIDLNNILELASNIVRLKILFLLNQEDQLCPCDLIDILQMSAPAISQHLRKMKDGGIIKARKVGQTIFYSIEEKHMGILKTLLTHIQVSTIKSESI